jgi:hypothetical protein
VERFGSGTILRPGQRVAGSAVRAPSVLTPNQPSLKVHDEPLSDEAISALFGQGGGARRTLIRAWFAVRIQNDSVQPTFFRQVLHASLAYKEPALALLLLRTTSLQKATASSGQPTPLDRSGRPMPTPWAQPS